MPTAPDLITQLGYDYSEYRSVILEDIPLFTLYGLLATKIEISDADPALVRQLLRQDVNRMQLLSLIVSKIGGSSSPGDVSPRAAGEQLFQTLGFDLDFYRQVMRTGFSEYDLVALIATKVGVDDVDLSGLNRLDLTQLDLLCRIAIKVGSGTTSPSPLFFTPPGDPMFTPSNELIFV